MIIEGHYRTYNIHLVLGAVDISKNKVTYTVNFRIAIDIDIYTTRESQMHWIRSFMGELWSWYYSSNTSYCRFVKYASYSEDILDELSLPNFEYGNLPLNQIAKIRRKHCGIWESDNGDKLRIICPEPVNESDIILDSEDIIPYSILALDMHCHLVTSKNTLITKFISSKYLVK